MAKQLITADARRSRTGILRQYLLREGLTVIAALTVLFLIVRVLLPRLVNAHDDILLAAAFVVVLAVLAASIWLFLYVRTRFKAFRRQYLAARDD